MIVPNSDSLSDNHGTDGFVPFTFSGDVMIFQKKNDCNDQPPHYYISLVVPYKMASDCKSSIKVVVLLLLLLLLLFLSSMAVFIFATYR
jgi:hypothetical protein